MRPRSSVLEIFSTFLQFDAERFSGWATDPRLRRSMQSCLARSPQPESEHFWALYWYKVWLPQPTRLAEAHLSAYLQETCYWTAQKTVTSFASGQYTLSDCYQIAIVRIDKVLKGFNPNQGFTIKNYARAIFSTVIREVLRQRHEVDVCTPWALLRKLSQKRLVESLCSCAGLSSEVIGTYVLAWNCFKTIYVPTQATATRKLSKPDDATWKAIATLYNAQRHQLPLPSSDCKPETLEKWLLNCAKAARSYLYPALISINTPIPGQESGELLDMLPGEGTSLLAEIIDQEEQQNRAAQQTQINTVLVAAIAQIESPVQQLLQLYYSQGLTQQQMASQLEVKQYTVSRRLTKARESLLLTLAQWSRDTMHISLSSDVLKDISTVLEDWLQNYYSHPNALSSLK